MTIFGTFIFGLLFVATYAVYEALLTYYEKKQRKGKT